MFDKGNCSLRTDRWRYIRYNEESEELYDLKNDPNEWHNLGSDGRHDAVKRVMGKLLEDRLDQLGN